MDTQAKVSQKPITAAAKRKVLLKNPEAMLIVNNQGKLNHPGFVAQPLMHSAGLQSMMAPTTGGRVHVLPSRIFQPGSVGELLCLHSF